MSGTIFWINSDCPVEMNVIWRRPRWPFLGHPQFSETNRQINRIRTYTWTYRRTSHSTNTRSTVPH